MACPRAKINLTACEGATFEKNFIWKTGDPAVEVDLTGYSGLCHVRDKIEDSTKVFELVDGTGVVIKDQVTSPGGYKMFISDAVTEGKCTRNKEREMVYDLKLTAPDGTVRLQQYGTFILYPAVTR